MSNLKKKAQVLIGALRGHKLPEGAAAAVDDLEQHLNGVEAAPEETAPVEEAGPEGEETAVKSKSKTKKKANAEKPADA